MKRLAPIVAVIAVAIVVMFTVTRPQTAPVPTAVPHYQSEPRAIRVVDQPLTSTGEGPVVAELVSGQIPADVTSLTVLTDENCQPDQDGVSHCLNRVQFTSSNGAGEATLQHHHRMAEVPCLAPGETLRVIE